MRITPLDVRKQEFRKGVRGLDADEVYAFLATVADEYEVVLTDNKKLRERVIELDEKVGEYRNMEKTLRDTLLTAERVMTEARQNARKEADLILRDAQMKASQEVAGINGRVEALHQQIRELRGHRDSYLARLSSLSEAQLGLIDSYRRDFEASELRIERSAAESGPRAPRAVAPAQERAARPAESIPAFDPPADRAPRTAPAERAVHADDQWRGYDVRSAGSGPAPRAGATARPQPHPPVPASEELRWEGPELVAPRPQQRLSKEEYDARVASVADAWSGAVPRVESAGLPEGEALAIDEVSAALGLFEEDGDLLSAPAGLEVESEAMWPVSVDSGPVSAGPRSSRELASGPFRTESVEHVEGAEGRAPRTIEASAGSGPAEQTEDGQGRWSLSRIARGLTGH